MKDLVNVERDSATDNSPQPDYTGTPRYRSVPCTIMAVAGVEVFRGRQLKADTTHVVDMQHIPDIVPDDRLSVTGGWKRGSTLHVSAVRQIEAKGRAMKLELDCKEITL